MNEGKKTELVAARLTRVPWWRLALQRLGERGGRRHHQTLQRLAERDVTDTVGEEDVKSWLAMLEGEQARAAADQSRRPKR